jgi:alpha-1,4-digalacturonate transport system substrate-binding protein
MRKLALLLIVALLLSGLGTATRAAQAVELRMTFYTDGAEDKIMRELLDKFEAANPDIKVVMDVVDYATGIQKTLPTQLGAGEGPDMARVTDLGGLSKYYIDLRPFLKDAKYWEDNMGSFLAWMRQPGDTTSIPGFMTQLTVTGPYINRTLFEQAGVAVPSDKSDKVTWEEWVAAGKEVAQKTGTPFVLAMDRSGHRLAGPAVSMGAKYFGEDGKPSLLNDAGFRTMAEMMVNWHKDGIMPIEVWGGSAGTYVAANEEFINAKVVMYMSGSWQISQFATKIGDAFDWEAVPNPCGPAACTGMPGGAALVALKTTKNPEAVAKVMEFLAAEENLSEFYARTLFIPGHLGIAGKGVAFQTENPQAKRALTVFANQVGKLDPLAYRLQGYTFNSVLFNANRDRLSQVFVGELSLDDAIKRMQEDIDAKLKEAGQ